MNNISPWFYQMSHNETASKFIILLNPICLLEYLKIFKTWKGDCVLCAETPDMKNNWEILPDSVDFWKGKKSRRGKMNAAMEENVGQIRT